MTIEDEHAAAINQATAEQGGPIGDRWSALAGAPPQNQPRRAPDRNGS